MVPECAKRESPIAWRAVNPAVTCFARAKLPWSTRALAGAWAAVVAVLAGLGLAGLGLAGCASAASAGATGTSCGQTRTAAGVPVTIDVVKGPVDCAAALRVEAAYAAAIRDGDLRGNGGGAPVTVDGWTCESYPSPQALRTGDVSACHTANAEVVAVLSLPSASASTGS